MNNIGADKPPGKRVDQAGAHLRTPTETELLGSTAMLDGESNNAIMIDTSSNRMFENYRSPLELEFSMHTSADNRPEQCGFRRPTIPDTPDSSVGSHR